jgi:hypothetical protein
MINFTNIYFYYRIINFKRNFLNYYIKIYVNMLSYCLLYQRTCGH